jgi:hypothetical protein
LSENQHACSISLLVIRTTFQNSTSVDIISTYNAISFAFEFVKKLAQLDKIYEKDDKFKRIDDIFDFKLRIFHDKCRRVELSKHAYMQDVSFMLTSRTLIIFYENRMNETFFDKFCIDMKNFFKSIEWKRLNLIKWQFIHINSIVAVNSNLSLFECLQKLYVDLNIIQQELDSDYQESNHLRENLIRTCRDHATLIIELHNSSSNSSNLINSLYNSIINYESINKSKHTYLQDIDIDDCTHDHNFTNKQYRRESFTNHDNRKLLTDSRSRDRFSVRASRKCFVCDKINCWSTNHTKKKIDD